MKLSFKLAIMNIRRYPLRIIGSIVCLLLFGFALFSAVTFTRSLKNTVAKVLKLRSSGNIVLVKTDIGELDAISDMPDVLEALPYYQEGFVNGEITIDGIGEFEVNLFYEQSQNAETLIPQTYLNEFRALGGENVLVAGRMPEGDNEMIICENFCKNKRIINYDDILNKTATISHDFIGNEKIIDHENVRLVGIFSEDFLDIAALENFKSQTDNFGSTSAFIVNPESKYQGIVAYSTIDNVDSVCDRLSEKYGGVIKTVFTSEALDKLSGLHLFIGNLMYLAADAIAFIYLMTRIISALNYFREKAPFITAADAFGCGKPHILGAFAAENIVLLIPISIISALVSCSFIKLIFKILSAYLGIEFETVIDFGSILTGLALMVFVDLLILLISFLLFRKRAND